MGGMVETPTASLTAPTRNPPTLSPTRLNTTSHLTRSTMTATVMTTSTTISLPTTLTSTSVPCMVMVEIPTESPTHRTSLRPTATRGLCTGTAASHTASLMAATDVPNPFAPLNL